MNWFELAENGGGFVSGGGWGVSDLKLVADTSANTLTLQPNFNTYGDNLQTDIGLTKIQVLEIRICKHRPMSKT